MLRVLCPRFTVLAILVLAFVWPLAVPAQEPGFEAAGLTGFGISPNYPFVSATDGGSFPVNVRIFSQDTASAMTATVDIPAGWSIVTNGTPTIFGGNDAPGSCTSGASGTQGTLAFSATGGGGVRSCDFFYTVTVPAGVAVGFYSVTATPSVTQNEPPTADDGINQIRIGVFVRADHDLVADVVTPLPAEYAAGESLSGAISFTNTGPETALNVAATVSGLDLTSSLASATITCTQGGAPCADVTLTSGPDATGTATYAIATMDVGEAPYVFTVDAVAAAAPAGPVTIAGSVALPGDVRYNRDPDTSDNAAQTVAALRATGTVDLTITTGDGGAVPAGAEACVAGTCEPAGSTVRLEGIDPGTYELTVQSAEPYLDATIPVTVQGGQTTAVTVVLERPEATPIPTPSPTPTPTPSPTVEPTSTPTEVPAEDVALTVTGDPRFPVSGSVALDTPGLSYGLLAPPDNGVVTLLPDGTFTYVAASQSVTFDQFVVRASDGTTITVTLVLEVDPSVPTYGEVKPGGTGYGGPEEDARNPGSTTPDDDEDSGSDDEDDDDDDGPVEAR